MTTPAADALFTTRAMTDVFSAQALVRQMLRFESALARAEARAGIVPVAAADAIAAACHADRYDASAILAEAARAGTPAIPLVRLLTERVDPASRGWVHWGATSQDVVDTALVLQMRDGLDLLAGDLHAVAARAADLAQRHRHAVMAGRTLLQHASPVTFGLKSARWLALVVRQIDALDALRVDALALQLGGAVGTLAPLGAAGLAVVARLAEELGLPAPDLPWHAERDRIARVAAAVGIVAGAMSKIAGDVVLLAQTEVGEVAAGDGGSSAMPQKRNPVDAMSALASARLAVAMVPTLLDAGGHEHERAAGAWQAEWVAIPQLFGHTASAVASVRRMLDEAKFALSSKIVEVEARTSVSRPPIMPASATGVSPAQISKSSCPSSRVTPSSVVNCFLSRAGLTTMLFSGSMASSIKTLFWISSRFSAALMDSSSMS